MNSILYIIELWLKIFAMKLEIRRMNQEVKAMKELGEKEWALIREAQRQDNLIHGRKVHVEFL